MNIYQLFKSKSKLFYFFLVMLGAANSIMYSGLLFLINTSITKTSAISQKDVVLYFSIILISALCSKAFQTYMVKLSSEILYTFEIQVLEKIRYADYISFEKLGIEKIYTAIGDTKVLSRIPETFISFFNALVISLCCLGYMFSISFLGGISILSVMFLLLLIYLKRNKNLEAKLNVLRNLQNDYHRYLRDLLNGYKEIKLSITRGQNIFLNFLYANKSQEKALGVDTSIKYLNNELLGSYSWYIVLGFIMYLLPQLTTMNSTQTSTFIVTILYLIGPVATLITTFPFYTRVKIAFERLKRYESDVDFKIQNQMSQNSTDDICETFERIVFKNVKFDYFNSTQDKAFSIGPINLEIIKGEVLFVIGGNGSGKSTFINLLTGLYQPNAGDLFFNKIKIDSKKYPYYRNKISAIFTNNYLFEENYDGFDISESNDKLNSYIQELELSNVINVDNKKGISSKLSKGQQKRLAMIYSLMEEREILVLDEWAAEQDPVFRSYFYKTLIGKLRQMGKTIIAVTHDDAYFSYADRLLKFDYGRLSEQTLPAIAKECPSP